MVLNGWKGPVPSAAAMRLSVSDQGTIDCAILEMR